MRIRSFASMGIIPNPGAFNLRATPHPSMARDRRGPDPGGRRNDQAGSSKLTSPDSRKLK